MNVNLLKNASRSAAVLILGGLASACAFNPPVDPASSLSTQIDSVVAQKTEYPRWQDFPAAPVNVPDAAHVRTSVEGLEAGQAVLTTQVNAIDWQMGDAEEFVASIQSKLAADGVEIPTANTPAEIEAFAAALRERAKAPPPIDRPMR